MADIKPRDYVTGAIIFTILIVSVISLIDLAYEEDADFVEAGKYDDFQESFDKRQALNANITALQARLEQQAEPSLLTQINIFFSKGYSILNSLFTSFGFVEDIITGSTDMFGFLIPNWLPALVVSLITTMLIFSIVSALLSRDI